MCFLQVDDLQRAVPCAYTYLQRNPEDQEMLRLMEEYKSQYDLTGYLTDYEEQPHEVTHFKFLFYSIIPNNKLKFFPMTVSSRSFNHTLKR